MNVNVSTGSVLSGYRIERLIGAGATGAVYLARDETLDRPAAVKILGPELARDERFRERFLRESRAAARIEHPGIVPIYAAGEADGHLFIAMRYVAGGDLSGVIEREGRIDAQRALTLLAQVASGLDAAHAEGLIHRDVKPGNILVDGDHAWLGDFGLAKHAATVNSLTRDTTFAGTVDYIAPEQIQGGDVDGRADVYALGCVLFECLTGRAPFERDNDLAVVFAHLRDVPPSITALRDDLPAALDGVVERALAKNPDQRYATCAEMIDDARTATSGGDVVVPPPGASTIRTFLICDVRGYTRYTQQHGDEAAAELAATFADLVRHEVQRFEGRLIELRGDEALVTFTSARQAVRAALAIQRAVGEKDLPRGVGVGLDSGEAVPVGAGYRGGALNMAARLCSMAEPGQVLATEGVVHLARKVEGARYLTGQVARLKGIEKPVRVIEIVPQDRGDVILQRLRRRAKGRRWRRLALPAAVAAAALAAFLVMRGGSGEEPALADITHPHTVAGFDTRTGAYVRTVLGHLDDPGYLMTEGRRVWSLDNGVVLVIDPATSKVVKRIPVGDANYMAAGDGSLWVGSAKGPTVTRIDPVYGTTIKRIHLPTSDLQDWNHAPDSIVYAAGSLWVAHAFQAVRRVDPETGRVEHTWPMFGVKELAAGDGAIFAASNDSGTLYRINPADNRIEWKTKLHPWIDGIVVAGGYVWLTTNSDESLFKFDLGTGNLIKSIPTGSADSRMVAGDGAIWVENSRGGTVTRVDVATDRTHTFHVGHSPAGLALVGHELLVGLTPSPEDELKGVTGKTAKISLREDWLDGQSDPATTWGTTGQQLEYATQLKLYNYPDRNGTAGGVPIPEAATGMPLVSEGGRTVTIQVRPGFTFSPPSNAPVTAETFRYSIERAFALGNAPLFLPELVGWSRFANGAAQHISGLTAAGDSLTLHLTKPTGDIAQVLAMPFFSVVPEGTPFEQVNEPIPSAGPYYIVKHDWYVVVKRNPNYHGDRPQHLDAIVYQINLDTATAAAQAIDGRMDVVMDPEGDVLQPGGDLARRYGTSSEGHPRYLRYPIRGTRFMTLNNRHGPLRDLAMRRAISYAIDRPALAEPDGSVVTDHYLPAGMPGAQLHRHVYPVDGPDIAAARKLMHGRRVTLSLWTCDRDVCAERARLLKAELERIGIHLRVRAFADLYGQGDGYDIRDDGWVVDEFDPVNMLGVATFAQPGYLDDPTFVDAAWQRRVERADALRPDQGRFKAFGRLELQMMRDASPWAAYGQQVERVFLSARVGCTIVSPVYGLDLAAMCVNG